MKYSIVEGLEVLDIGPPGAMHRLPEGVHWDGTVIENPLYEH